LGLPGAEGPAEPGDLGDRVGGEAVEDFGRDLAALGGDGVVDRAELLVTLPGDVHLILWVAGVEAGGDLGLLAFGEVLHTVAE